MLRLNRTIRQFSSSAKIITSLKAQESKLNPLEHAIKIIINTIGAPLGIGYIQQNYVVPYFTFGKYDGYATPGLTWVPPFSKRYDVFCGDITLSHTNMHLTDLASNPIRVSSFVIYNITNPVNQIVNLDSTDLLSNWIEGIIRDEISNYSYLELTSSLQKDQITSKLVGKINSDPKAEFYGIEVQKAGLLEINYAPEIAETMLVKQKAKATIEARKELVDATINLIEDISEKLDSKLTPGDKSKLITCLTVSMIGSGAPNQVISLN